MTQDESRLESEAHRLLQLWYAKLSHLEKAGVHLDSADVSEEERRFRLSIPMHPDIRDVIAQVSEFPASHWWARFVREGQGNSVLHVVVHAAVKGAAQEDPHFKPAYHSLVEQARAYQANAEAWEHVAEHALGMILLEYMWRASRESPEDALRKLHDAPGRCAKWKRVPKAIVQQIRTPLNHNV